MRLKPRKKMHDPACHTLAEMFLTDTPALMPKVDELAQTIQDAVEDWIASETPEEK